MSQGALHESSDEDPTDKLNDHLNKKRLSCPSCKATKFPSLSKLKSVLLLNHAGILLINTRIASIGTRTINHMHVLHAVASNDFLNDRILIGIPKVNMAIQRTPPSFTTAL
jgi:hypothetical protein